jgi:hypothetical protein
MKTKLFLICVSVAAIGTTPAFINAAPQSDQNKKSSESSQRDTVAKPMTDKQRKKQEEKLRKELETPYKKWLNEDVVYIITDEEKAAFKRLSTDDERNSSNSFGCVATPRRIRKKTSLKKSTIAASLTPTNITRPASRAGKRIAAGSILSTGRRTRSNRIPRAEPTSGHTKKAAAPPPPTRLNSGATGTSRASAITS